MPAIYFRRLGFLAYLQGKLPSEVAREILKEYLDIGCMNCGGPVFDIDMDHDMLTATCLTPNCEPVDNVATPTSVCDYSDYAQKSQLPGFSNRLDAAQD